MSKTMTIVDVFAVAFEAASDADLLVNQESDEQAGVFRFSRYFAYGDPMYAPPDLHDAGPLGDLVRDACKHEMGTAAYQTAAKLVRALTGRWDGITVHVADDGGIFFVDVTVPIPTDPEEAGRRGREVAEAAMTICTACDAYGGLLSELLAALTRCESVLKALVYCPETVHWEAGNPPQYLAEARRQAEAAIAKAARDVHGCT